MTGVEIDFVVADSLAALALYEKIFEVERIEVTNFPNGQNETVFTIYGVRFHMLGENQEFQLIAPQSDALQPFWFNVSVPDIKETHKSAIAAGCTEIQPLSEMTDYGVSNSMFADSFGYLWMLHQIHRVISFDERVRLWDEGAGDDEVN